jgi:hypothetical protein
MYRNHAATIAVTAAAAILSFAAIVVGAPTPVTAVLGIAMLASLGCVWIQVLLGHDIAGLERITVATGLTVAVPVLGGLALQAAGVPLHRTAWAGLLTCVTLTGDILLAIRYRAARRTTTPRQPNRWRLSPWHAVAYGAAVVITVGAVGIARVGAAIQHYPGYTELWLSPQSGNSTTAALGVSNHQGGTERYRLVLLHRRHVTAIWNITLSDGQTWQRTISITSNRNTIADLYLKPDLTHPYRYVDTDPA